MGSDRKADRKADASASSSLADFESLLRKYQDRDSVPINERLYAGNRRPVAIPTAQSAPYGTYSMAINSLASQQIRYDQWPSCASRPPSLVSYGTTMSSISTYSRADNVMVAEGPIDGDGRAPLPEPACEFWWLEEACKKRVESSQWHRHCLAHLGGLEPPKRVVCPMAGCAWRRSDDPNGNIAWLYRQRHIISEHFDADNRLVGEWKPRPAPELVEHFTRNKLISSCAAKQLLSTGRINAAEAFVSRHGASRNSNQTGSRGPAR